MILNPHLDLKGKHATFGASKWHWINYETDEDFERAMIAEWAADVGTGVHDFARRQIKYGKKVGNNKDARNNLLIFLLEDCKIPEYAIDIDRIFENYRNYVNDCIGFHMTPEAPIYYGDNVFGTTDAILFTDNTLRIFDLKTGVRDVHPEQLMIYVAFFCLEYRIKPKDITIELRIYQNGEVGIIQPETQQIEKIMSQAIRANKIALRMTGSLI